MGLNRTHTGRAYKMPINEYEASFFTEKGELIQRGPVRASSRPEAAKLMRVDPSDVKCLRAHLSKDRESIMSDMLGMMPLSRALRKIDGIVVGLKKAEREQPKATKGRRRSNKNDNRRNAKRK